MTDDLSRDYTNVDFIPDGESYPDRWLEAAAAFRRSLGERHLALTHGTHPRHTVDLFLPAGGQRPSGLVVFIHGGYWLRFEPAHWSHFAAGALARGWAVAMPGYTLAPEARISEITTQIARAIGVAAGKIDGPIIVTGHSAGGHLTARMACTDIEATWTDRLQRVVPISPVADLRPLMRTAMNAQLQIDPDEAAHESPALRQKRPGVDCTVWVGGQERPSFLWQARTLSENWDCPWHVEPDRHHFDVIDDLANPDSALIRTLLAE